VLLLKQRYEAAQHAENLFELAEALCKGPGAQRKPARPSPNSSRNRLRETNLGDNSLYSPAIVRFRVGEFQLGPETYADNQLDRGHLVRRAPNWKALPCEMERVMNIDHMSLVRFVPISEQMQPRY